MKLSKLKDILKRVTGPAKDDLEEADKLKEEREALRQRQRTVRRKVQKETDTAIDEMTQTTFDLTRHGMVVAGHATDNLPQVVLELEGDDIYAQGVLGLIYGYSSNTLFTKGS